MIVLRQIFHWYIFWIADLWRCMCIGNNRKYYNVYNHLGVLQSFWQWRWIWILNLVNCQPWNDNNESTNSVLLAYQDDMSCFRFICIHSFNLIRWLYVLLFLFSLCMEICCQKIITSLISLPISIVIQITYLLKLENISCIMKLIVALLCHSWYP